MRAQGLTVERDGFGTDQDKGDDAVLCVAVVPIVHRAPLYQHVTRPECHDHAVVKFHIDLSRHHDRVVNGVSAVVSRQDARLVANNSKNTSIVQSGFVDATGWIDVAFIVNGKALC